MGVCTTKEYRRSIIVDKTLKKHHQQRMENFYSNITDILSILSDDVDRSEIYQSIIISTRIDQKRQDPVWKEFIQHKTTRKNTKTDIWLRMVFNIKD